MSDPLLAIVCLLILIVLQLVAIERRIEREARRARELAAGDKLGVDEEMRELNPNGISK